MERQNQELQHALSSMSKQLDQTNTNKETLLKDVSTARHVSLGLQSNTDQLQRKLMEISHVMTSHRIPPSPYCLQSLLTVHCVLLCCAVQSRDLLNQKLTQLSSDNATLIATLSSERTRYRELEQLCQQIRMSSQQQKVNSDEAQNALQRAVTQHQLRVAQLTAEKQALTEQMANVWRDREQQQNEVSRLTQMLAASVAIQPPNG
jgi:hypothetical protein